MGEVLDLVRDFVERKNNLLYAAKCAAARLSGGQHFPEYLDESDDAALVACLLAAIALTDVQSEDADLMAPAA